MSSNPDPDDYEDVLVPFDVPEHHWQYVDNGFKPAPSGSIDVKCVAAGKSIIYLYQYL